MSDMQDRDDLRSAPAVTSNGLLALDPLAESCYVRALYPFSSTEPSSLGFHPGDLIRVLTKLESGWWDGLLRGERGWFPSNYVEEVEIIDSDDEAADDFDEDHSRTEQVPIRLATDSVPELATVPETDSIETIELPKPEESDTMIDPKDDAAFWIPQTSSEGRVYFFNTVSGISKWDLPFEPLRGRRSKVIETFKAPITTGLRAPKEPFPDAADQELTTGDVLQSFNYRLLPSEGTQVPGSTWRSSLGRSMLSNGSSLEEGDNGEILLFAARDGGALQDHNGDGSLDALGNFVPLMDHLAIAKTSTDASEYLDGASIHLTAKIDALKRSVQAGKKHEYQGVTKDIKALVVEITQTCIIKLAVDDVPATPFGSSPSGLGAQRKNILERLSHLLSASHVASDDWGTPEGAQNMLTYATQLQSTIEVFLSQVRDNPHVLMAATLQPAAVPMRFNAGGWQGNGLIKQTRSSSLGQQLSSEAAADLENLVKQIQSNIKLCRAKGKQFEKEQSALAGTVILRETMLMLGMIRKMLDFCEQLDLSPLSPPPSSGLPHSPTIADFAKSKQLVYDASAHLVLSAQAMTSPNCQLSARNVTNLNGAFADMESALQAVVLHTSFMVQEYVAKYAQLDTNQYRSEIILESDPLRRLAKMKRVLGDDVPPESPILLSSTFTGTRSPALSSMSGGHSVATAGSTPWFLENEYESELSYDSKGNVKAGTLLALVERLTRHDQLDAVYNNTFLLTYRSFTTAEELSSLLIQRFLIEPPKGMSPAQFEAWIELKQNPVQLRVFNIFKFWMENFFVEPPNDATREWLARLKHFVRTVMGEHISSATALVNLIEKRIVQGDVPFRKLVPNHLGYHPQPIVPRNLRKIRLLDLDALEVARQLTIMESTLYNKIKPTECLDKSWSKPDAAEGAENIKAMILHSNQITAWVAEAILYQTDLKKRVNLIKHFVHIAEKCRLLNNFSTLTAIISGLNSAPIHRLRRTWDLLNTRIAMSAEDLNRLMNSSKNFSQYREALHQTQPPCVPFLGVYLTDLTFIEDGNPNMSVKARHLINISKRQKTADVIRDIQQYQSVPYALQPVPEIQSYIRSCMDITRDISELYNISLEREPREREDEKIARLLQESGFL